MEHKTILMIEDDKSLITLNGKMLAALSGGGFSTLTAVTLAEAREKLTGGIDLILLDVMLPDGNGLDFVREIRAVTGAPIIMLTARRESEQITEGLLAGGVDYITKPYRMEELYARVSAQIKQAQLRQEPPKRLTRGPLTLDIVAGRAFLNGADMLLTTKEFAVLHYFLRNEGRAIPKEELYEAAWGQPMTGDDGVLRKTVSNLRKHFENCGDCALDIEMLRGAGYEFTYQS